MSSRSGFGENWKMRKRLDECDLRGLDADEFYDVYRLFRPDASREEFQGDWDKFQALKSEYLAKNNVQ